MPSLNARYARRKAVGVSAAACIAVMIAACGTIVAPASKTSAPRSARETASVINWTSSSGAPRTAAVRQVLAAVNAAFAQAEDTYEAMFALPPPPGTPISALENNMATAPRDAGLHWSSRIPERGGSGDDQEPRHGRPPASLHACHGPARVQCSSPGLRTWDFIG
jgi:hypothetical protein